MIAKETNKEHKKSDAVPCRQEARPQKYSPPFCNRSDFVLGQLGLYKVWVGWYFDNLASQTPLTLEVILCAQYVYDSARPDVVFVSKFRLGD